MNLGHLTGDKFHQKQVYDVKKWRDYSYRDFTLYYKSGQGATCHS
jgi:hypothetical protein